MFERIRWNLGFITEGSREDRYCIHGTFIGDPYGPDYMCGRCEDGWTCGHNNLFWSIVGCETCRRMARYYSGESSLWVFVVGEIRFYIRKNFPRVTLSPSLRYLGIRWHNHSYIIGLWPFRVIMWGVRL